MNAPNGMLVMRIVGTSEQSTDTLEHPVAAISNAGGA